MLLFFQREHLAPCWFPEKIVIFLAQTFISSRWRALTSSTVKRSAECSVHLRVREYYSRKVHISHFSNRELKSLRAMLKLSWRSLWACAALHLYTSCIDSHQWEWSREQAKVKVRALNAYVWRVREPWAIQQQSSIWNYSRPPSRPLVLLTSRSSSPLNQRQFTEDVQRQLYKPRVVPLHCVLELRCRIFQLNHRSRCQLCA